MTTEGASRLKNLQDATGKLRNGGPDALVDAYSASTKPLSLESYFTYQKQWKGDMGEKRISTLYALLSVLLFSVSLILVFGYRDGRPPWEYSMGELYAGGISVSAFLFAVFALIAVRVKRYGFLKWSILSALIIVVSTYIVVFFLYFLDIGISRVAVISALILLSAGILFLGYFSKNQVTFFTALLITATLAMPSYRSIGNANEIKFATNAEFLFSSYSDLKITTSNLNLATSQEGGAIAYTDENEALVVTGSGNFIRVRINGEDIEMETTSLKSPLELEEYNANTTHPNRWYRITDALLLPNADGGKAIFVTHTHWNAEDNCYTFRLSRAIVDTGIAKETESWSTLFESKPCLPHAAINNEAGGRMAVLESGSVLFTVGSLKYEDLEPDSFGESDYGKIFQLDLTTNETRIYSKGHRNAQGLLVTESGIWATEHGPFGGDELNYIVDGGDYGWPYQSYGTDYGKKVLSLTATSTGDHSAATRPIFSWTPSIGISNLVQIEGDDFGWKGDLLIGSLNGLGAGYSLFRTKIREKRAVTIEKIATGQKIRDLVELDDGRLMLWNGLDKIQILSPADTVYSTCAGCHALRRATHGIGPDLWGVVGSKIARHDGFEYSDAMEQIGGTWTPAQLDRFLRDPQATIPGTTMDFPGIEDRQTRQEIIQYLGDIPKHR